MPDKTIFLPVEDDARYELSGAGSYARKTLDFEYLAETLRLNDGRSVGG